MRVLTDPDIPPSAGAYRPIEVRAPEGSLLNARPGAAVVAGNVETSSRVADLVLAAFGRALGQGTMNNLTLGNDDFTYYETIGGGQGACPDADGPSGVHVAMSNTLNTPVEALELEFPLRVVEYSLRRGTGGAGRFRGGDGIAREVEALAPMDFSLLTERRRHPPPGADGGEPGARGRNLLDGEELPPKAGGRLEPRLTAADRDAGRRGSGNAVGGPGRRGRRPGPAPVRRRAAPGGPRRGRSPRPGRRLDASGEQHGDHDRGEQRHGGGHEVPRLEALVEGDGLYLLAGGEDALRARARDRGDHRHADRAADLLRRVEQPGGQPGVVARPRRWSRRSCRR